MQNIKKKFIPFAALSAVGALMADSNGTATVLGLRSEGRDSAAKIVQMYPYHIHLADMSSYYGTFDLQFEYDQSFRGSRLAHSMFGDFLVDAPTTTTTTGGCDDDCGGGRTLNISGTGANPATGTAYVTRGANDLMAENFYLARDFQSSVTFNPKIKTFQLKFDFYMGLDEWCKGLYFRLYGPLAHSKWSLDMFENVVQAGTRGYEAGYFDDASVAPATLLQSFSSYMAGNVPTIADLTLHGLENAKVSCENHSATYFAELRGELGYDFLSEEDYHLGVNVQFAAPTGGRPSPEFLFAPQKGNGKAWELGGGVTGHYVFWRSECESRQVIGSLEADITHMFGAKQCRTLDLKGKPLSRYMLAEKMSSNAVLPDLLGGTTNPGTAPTKAFAKEYAPVANFSTQEVKVTSSVQADIAVMLTFVCKGFTWDLGYNFWVRSCENVDLREHDCNDFPSNTWALKGDASVFGFATTGAGTAGVSPYIPDLVTPTAFHVLSSTDSGADIHVGTNFGKTNPLTNPNIDNAQNAQSVSTTATSTTGAPFLVAGTQFNIGTANETLRINTSIQPVFISADDLDTCASQTRGLSNKVFTHLGYTWTNCEDWIPYVGIGAKAEFGQHNGGNSDCGSDSSSACSSNGCNTTAVSQWGVWLKAGLSFN